MKKYRITWRSPDCGYYGHRGIIWAQSENDILTTLAKICSCEVNDIELGVCYEIKPLDSTPKSPGLSREEIKNVMNLIQKHRDIQEYGMYRI